MKRILSLAIVLCMAFSLCALTACNNNVDKDPENIYADFEDFDSYVPKDSEIIGTWKMTSPYTYFEWQFFATTTLHQTETHGDVSTTTVCTYNYDGEGNLRVYVFNDKDEYPYTVEIEGNNLIVTDKDGKELTFVKE